MSANAPGQSDLVEFEIDGKAVTGRKGQMIIEVSDNVGIEIPRFCYHKKLPIAANCRMCLVEVEKAPKPMPACATPIMPGMKVMTRSAKALSAQKNVMEFLLINHPLDCPICDQGGECELQDISLGYGRSASRFTETKRVVQDKDVGPLIATEMTRCIHCTRCVRFLDVVAGQKELGGIGRGENTEIGTYVANAISSEMSGNVIDLCPVGALTAKPSRFSARAWELQSAIGISSHDSVGSNLYIHSRRGRVMRVVPRENEGVNEVWISDRDRFAYEGLYADDRAQKPMVKRGDKWHEVDWDVALTAAAEGLQKTIEKHGAKQIGGLISPTSTLEELALFAKLLRASGVNNIDHRLRSSDFSDDDDMPMYPGLGLPIAAIESLDAALIIGSNTRKELPLINHRLRKAALKGAKVVFANPRQFAFNYPIAQQLVSDPKNWAQDLALVLVALCSESRETPPSGLDQIVGNTMPSAEHVAVAQSLRAAKKAAVLIGEIASVHPQAAVLRQLATVIAKRLGVQLGFLPTAANGVGAWLAGAVPHRGVAGKGVSTRGVNAREMFEKPRNAYVLFGLEPELDALDGALALTALRGADFVVAMSSYVTDTIKSYASVILPISTFAETSGSYVNLERKLQSASGAVKPLGDSRPGWKVLRVLGNYLDLDGFNYESSEDVRAELETAISGVKYDGSLPWRKPTATPFAADSIMRCGDVATYGTDAVVRRAPSLQATPDAQACQAAAIGVALAAQLGVESGGSVRIQQGGAVCVVNVVVDESIAPGAVWLPLGLSATAGLGALYGAIEIQRA